MASAAAIPVAKKNRNNSPKKIFQLGNIELALTITKATIKTPNIRFDLGILKILSNKNEK